MKITLGWPIWPPPNSCVPGPIPSRLVTTARAPASALTCTRSPMAARQLGGSVWLWPDERGLAGHSDGDAGGPRGVRCAAALAALLATWAPSVGTARPECGPGAAGVSLLEETGGSGLQPLAGLRGSGNASIQINRKWPLCRHQTRTGAVGAFSRGRCPGDGGGSSIPVRPRPWPYRSAGGARGACQRPRFLPSPHFHSSGR